MRGVMKTLAIMGLLLMAALPIHAQTKTKDTIPENIKKSDLKKYIDEGNRLYQLGKESETSGDSLYSEALVNYAKALQADSNSVQGQFNLADAVYKMKDYETASKMFQHIAAETQDKNLKAKAYHNLGNSLLKSEKYKESMEAFKQSLKANPDDMDTKYNYAYAKQMLKQQQQQQQQNQDKKDDKKEQEDEQQQQQQDKKQDENKDQQQQQQQNQQQDKKEEQQQKQQPKPQNQMSKEEAERMLNAVERDEKDIQEKLRKVKGAKVKVEKDW